MQGVDVLLLFTEEYPCWDEKCVAMTGENPEELALLEKRGFLVCQGGVYSLTPAGEERFKEEAAASWYDAAPGAKPSDPARALRRNRLVRLLDRAFLGRWGLKKALPGKELPLVASLAPEEIASLEEERVRWHFLSHEFVRDLCAKYPPGEPGASSPDLEAFREWRAGKGQTEGSWITDLLMLHYCDFTEYMSYPSPPNDILKLYCADRLFCNFVPSCDDPGERMREMVRILGRWYLFMLGHRRIYMPYTYDVDPEEQDSVSWFFWVAATEEEAKEMAAELKRYGKALIEPGMPCDIWVISEEVLEAQPRQHEAFWDLFAEIAHPVSR